MDGFNAQELGYKGPPVSANDAIEEAKYQYAKMAREELNAGREIPVVDVPIELGDMAILSVESGDELLKESRTKRFMLSRVARANWDRIFNKDKRYG